MQEQLRVPPQTIGGPVSGTTLGSIITFLNRTAQKLPDSPDPVQWQVTAVVPGKVTTSPPTPLVDYSDSRYWVDLMVSQPSGTDSPSAKLRLISDGAYGAPTGPVTATNIAEMVGDTHSALQNGDFVVLAQIQDTNSGVSYPVNRWFIISGGAGGSIPVPQYQYMVVQATAMNQLGADWCHFSGMI